MGFDFVEYLVESLAEYLVEYLLYIHPAFLLCAILLILLRSDHTGLSGVSGLRMSTSAACATTSKMHTALPNSFLPDSCTH